MFKVVLPCEKIDGFSFTIINQNPILVKIVRDVISGKVFWDFALGIVLFLFSFFVLLGTIKRR